MNTTSKNPSIIRQIGDRIGDLLILNLLTVLCSLPIITIGASFSAMHYTLLRLYREEDGGPVHDFFYAFRRDFRQATLLWLIYLTAAALLFFDYWAVFVTGRITSTVFEVLFYAVGFLVLFSLHWIFILQSRYRQGILDALKQAFILSTGYFFYTVMFVILGLLPVFLAYFVPHAIPVSLLLGFSAPGYLKAFIYSRVFDRCEDRCRTQENTQSSIDSSKF